VYSAISYAHLFVSRTVAIVGDSDLAMHSAAELASQADQVYLIAPTHGQLDSALGQRLQRSGTVTILEGYQVVEIQGDLYADRLVVTKGNHPQTLAVDGIFVELGHVANSTAVAHLVDLDESARIKVDRRNQTTCPGLFAAGDVTDIFAEQVLIALGEGAKAALSCYEYLLDQGLMFDKRQARFRP
jgi:thioredoxin reductase